MRSKNAKRLTHYEVLELDEAADEAAIREQVIKLRKFWHSKRALKWSRLQFDLIYSNDVVVMRIDEAARILSDASEKLSYDRSLKNLPDELSEGDRLFRVKKEILLKDYGKELSDNIKFLKELFSSCRRAINSSLNAPQEEQQKMLQLIKHIDDQLGTTNPEEFAQLLLNNLNELNGQCQQDVPMVTLFCNRSDINWKPSPKEIPLKITVLAFFAVIYKRHLIFHFPSCQNSNVSTDTILGKMNSLFVKLVIESEVKKLKSEFPNLSENEVWLKFHQEFQSAAEYQKKTLIGSFVSEDETRKTVAERFSIRDHSDDFFRRYLGEKSLENIIVDSQIIDALYEQGDVVFNYLETKISEPQEFLEYIKKSDSHYPRQFGIEVITNNKFVDLLMTLVITIAHDTFGSRRIWPPECHLAFDKQEAHVYTCATDESLSCFWEDQRTFHRGYGSHAPGKQLAEADLRPKREGNPDAVLLTEGAYNCHVVLCVDRQQQRCWLLHVSPPLFEGFLIVNATEIVGRGKKYRDLELPYFDGDSVDHDQLEIYVFSNQAGQKFIDTKKLQSISPTITYHDVWFDKFDISYTPRTGVLIIRNSNAHDEMKYFDIDITAKNRAEIASKLSPRK